MRNYNLTNLNERELLKAIYNSQDNLKNKATEELLNRYNKIINEIAKQNLNKGLSLVDLLDAGTYGLLKAVKKFNSVEADTKFNLYAIWYIRQAINRAIYKK